MNHEQSKANTLDKFYDAETEVGIMTVQDYEVIDELAYQLGKARRNKKATVDYFCQLLSHSEQLGFQLIPVMQCWFDLCRISGSALYDLANRTNPEYGEDAAEVFHTLFCLYMAEENDDWRSVIYRVITEAAVQFYDFARSSQKLAA